MNLVPLSIVVNAVKIDVSQEDSPSAWTEQVFRRIGTRRVLRVETPALILDDIVQFSWNHVIVDGHPPWRINWIRQAFLEKLLIGVLLDGLALLFKGDCQVTMLDSIDDDFI